MLVVPIQLNNIYKYKFNATFILFLNNNVN